SRLYRYTAALSEFGPNGSPLPARRRVRQLAAQECPFGEKARNGPPRSLQLTDKERLARPVGRPEPPARPRRGAVGGDELDASTGQVRRKRARDRGSGRVARVQHPELDPPQSVVHAELVREAAKQVVAEDKAAACLAATNRFALPDVRARGAAGDSRRQEGRLDSPVGEGRRNQGRDPRARRQKRSEGTT